MSKELASEHGFEIGEKVLYPHKIGSNYGAPIHMKIVILKEITTNYKNEITVLVEDSGEYRYLDLSDIYSKKMIDKMFNPELVIHVNPNCTDSSKCKSHGETGSVEYNK